MNCKGACRLVDQTKRVSSKTCEVVMNIKINKILLGLITIDRACGSHQDRRERKSPIRVLQILRESKLSYDTRAWQSEKIDVSQ